ncbi:amidohydrolase family protein [Aromatoleum aromaticum]|uniref:amidohydrolase family protein n=1 Tax=Aromatoleum aromaticum TaxID=551760 RepID=UPI00203B43C0|nr:amidohydrolase family protein [Aromatoleum aromaticum]
MHTHVVPGDFPPYVGKRGDQRANVPWPSMVPAHACHRSVVISGSIFRTVSEQCWEGKVRIADMDGSGIDRQVLSPMPELLSYWLGAEDAVVLTRHLNETIARVVADHPERFSGIGAVPLQDVDLAIHELHHAVKVLGLAGVEIGTNVNGTPIGAPVFEPFYREVAQLNAAIFVHPLRPCGMERLIGPAALEQVLAFPCETGLAAMSLVTSGILARHPTLRIALSHGGGSFASLLARFVHASKTVSGLKDLVREPPLDTARRFYFDSLVYDPTLLRAQIDLFGETQTMIGTDYPFVIMEREPIARIAELGLGADIEMLLLRGNALRWLGMPVLNQL